jgi:hypothetical protein
MQVTILDAAEQDIVEACAFYERQAVGLGGYFLASVSADIASLAFFGGIHEKVHGRHRLLCKRFPFAVYYHLRDDEVCVTAALDCRRNPLWTRKRLM